MLPLPTLFKVDHDSPHYNEGQKQSIFYAQSWALMHYLIHRPGGSAAIDKFMKLTSGDTPMDQAFQQSFDTTFEKMEKELRAYIKHDSYPVTAGRFENKITFDSELQVAEVSEAEANAYLGDLLLHSNRADSEKYLQKALTLDANQVMANTSLAMLRVREGKIDEARSSLERAAAANSQNYLVHYYYAFALSREGMNDANLVSGYSKENLARMRAELKKAIELRPDFPESYGLLAFINLVDGSELDQSITLLKNILEVSPGRNDLTFTLAQIYLVKEDFKSSRELLERLSQNQSDSAVRRQAKNLLASLENRETSIASYRNARDGNGGAAGGAPRLKRRDQSGAEATAEEVQVEIDPFTYLREAMRQPAADEKQLQGMLLRLECDSKGVIFIVQVGDRLMKLRTTQFENIQITSFTTDAAGEITCGARKPQNVVVTFVPNTDPKAKVDGQLRSVEFVPEEFKLKN
jgi:predicted Zn-dependent protease